MPDMQAFAITGLALPLHDAGSRFAALHLAAQPGVEIETMVLSRTTSCPKVVARAQARRHMDHSPTAGQVSTATFSVSKATLSLLEATSRKTQASKTPTSKARASGRESSDAAAGRLRWECAGLTFLGSLACPASGALLHL
jgi:hypothetical protein